MIKKRKVYQSRFKNSRILTNKRKSVKKDTGFVKMFKLIFKMSFILLIIFGITYLFNNDYLKIKKIENKTTNDFSQKVDEIVKESLSGNKLFLLQNSNFLIFNTSDLENKIKDTIPEIKSATAKKKFPDKLEIETTLHEATLGWETQNKKYLLNEEGYILKETDSLDGFLTVKDSTNLPLDKNNQVVYANFINFCKQINDKTASMGIKILYLEIKETTFIVNAYTEGGFKIIFNTTKSIEDQITKLIETVNFLAGNINKLDYVDVTVKNKAVYKLR